MLGGGWDRIDRAGMRAFFERMKRADGGFTVCLGGEVDVRCVARPPTSRSSTCSGWLT